MPNAPTFCAAADTSADVRRYCGEVLRGSADLGTSAGCAGDRRTHLGPFDCPPRVAPSVPCDGTRC